MFPKYGIDLSMGKGNVAAIRPVDTGLISLGCNHEKDGGDENRRHETLKPGGEDGKNGYCSRFKIHESRYGRLSS
jgi:hypothetical protein